VSNVIVPTLNTNDDSYVLVEWLVEPADELAAGDAVAVLETSKAASELTAETPGFLTPLLPAGSACRPGQVIGRIAATEAESAGQEPATFDPGADASGEPLITRAARILMEEHGVDVATVRALGRDVVKAADVQTVVESSAPTSESSSPEGLSPHQAAVARTVSVSHATIPPAFLAIKVPLQPLERHRRRIADAAKAFVGLPELVIKAVAGRFAAFPNCFAGLSEDLRVRRTAQADIGVTIDVGTGLFVPVIRDAARLTEPEIAAELARQRLRAARRTVRAEDLTGGAITVTIHGEPDIVLAGPIVFPGQSCALAMCGAQQELRIGADGSVEVHEYFLLSLSYDHRLINGREAMAFLTAVRSALAEPESEPAPKAQDVTYRTREEVR
jgi:2-oxoglutarate dehydrogenase E2 component (dihydrolipoamide succinyltransferase)